MTLRAKTLMSLTLVVVIAPWAAAQSDEQPMMDNPAYATWSSFEVGAMVKTKTVGDALGTQISEMVVTQTLTSLDEDRAVVTRQATLVMMGQAMEQPAVEMEIPARIPDQSGQDGDAVAVADVEVEAGDETITVPAGTFDCHYAKTTMTMTVPAGTFDCDYAKTTMTMTIDGQETTSVTTIWTSDQVPGGQVRMVVVTRGGAGAGTTTMELLAYSAGGQ